MVIKDNLVEQVLIWLLLGHKNEENRYNLSLHILFF